MFVVESERDLLVQHKNTIDVLRHHEISDVKQLSNVAQVSWITAKKHVNVLEDALIIKQSNTGIFLNNDFGFFASLAIGGTQVKATLIDFSFRPVNVLKHSLFKAYFDSLVSLFPDTVSTEIDGAEEQILCCKTTRSFPFVQNISSAFIEKTISFFEKTDTVRLLGIGISLPGLIDWEHGIINLCPNFPELDGCALSTLIKNSVHEKILLNNVLVQFSHDTTAALLYEKERLYLPEYNYRSYKDAPNVACLYMGSGLGASFILQNRLLNGANYCVGEIGHWSIPLDEKHFETIIKGYQNSGNKKALKDVECYKYNGFSEPNKNLADRSCNCGQAHCLENEIRIKVFNSKDNDEFLYKTIPSELELFAKEHPYRYDLLKYFISQILNIIINALNCNIIILTGRILTCINDLGDEIEGLKMCSALRFPSNRCHIIMGSKRPDGTAIGAGILTYHYLIGNGLNIQW